MNPKTLEEIAETLKRMSKILAGLLLRDIEEGDQIRKIARLKQCGFSGPEIAKMLGTSAETVRSQMYSFRSKRRKRKKGTK